MNKQFYESLRKEISFAFTAEVTANKSLIPDNIVEGGTSKPVLIHNDKGNITGQYERVYAVATRAKGSSTCPIHNNAFAHSRVVRAVNQLPEHHYSLMMFCYTTQNTDWEFITVVAEYVWAKMEIFINGWMELNGKTLKVEKVKKLRSLTFSALLHFREGAANRKKLYTAELLANLIMVSSSNWRRDWAPFWNQLLTILVQLDEQSLILVARQSKAQAA